MDVLNPFKNYGVEVKSDKGATYWAYVDALSPDHARQQVQKTLGKGERITGVYLNTPKPYPGGGPVL